jgi:cysteine synthase A/cysteine synthase B
MEKHLLDLSGEVCPMTWARTRNALARLEKGQALEVIVDEGKPATELPRSAKAEGHRVRSVVKEAGRVRFVVESGGASTAKAPSTASPGAQPDSSPRPSLPVAAPKRESWTDTKLRRFDSVADLIGNAEDPTPLVRLSRVAPAGSNVSVKLEWMNPFGSIKDRTAKYLLEGMKKRGELEGKQLVEPSSGNTGIALAALANTLGVPTTVAIPDQVPEEKQALLRLLGATVWPTPDNMCPIDHPKDGAIALAKAIAKKPGYAMPNQYANPDNVRAHYETTGPEIWRQTEGKVRAVIAGYGTCGTLTGIGKFLKEKDPTIQIVAIEPVKGHRLPGLKNLQEAKIPEILDRSLIDETVSVDDETAYRMAIRLAREESLLVGPSTGAIVAAALGLAIREPGPIVAISPDSAFKYVSYFADWIGSDGRPPDEEIIL